MIEKIINKVGDIYDSVHPVVWWGGLAMVVVLAFGFMVKEIAGYLSEQFTALDEVYRIRQETYEKRVEEVKRDCDLRQQVLSPAAATYRYRCADGVEFEFTESL